jgi:hypothetical protein
MKKTNIKAFFLFLTVIALVLSLASCTDCAHVDENGDCVCELCEGGYHVDADGDKACDKCGTSVWIEVFSAKFESFVGVNPFTMVFAWVNLVILYFILKKLAFKPIKNMIDSRQQEIDDMYSGAEAAQRDADAAKVEYEAKLQAAKTIVLGFLHLQKITHATREGVDRNGQLVDGIHLTFHLVDTMT